MNPNQYLKMKNLFLTALCAIALASCNQSQKTTEKTPDIPAKTYPAHITSIFNAHGGIATWNAQNTLKYTIADADNGDQTHTVDLKSRKIRHDAAKYVLGFDGEKVWLKQDSTYFNPERARFSHNLMFYFYAMPFVLGDDGITYSDVAPFVVGDVSYPGTKISFGDGVGDAPDDNYIVYSDPETNQMTWLAYTVTYGKGEASERYSYIKYPEWTAVNGVQLPTKLEWYAVADGVVGDKRFERVFINTSISEEVIPTTAFDKPEDGVFVE